MFAPPPPPPPTTNFKSILMSIIKAQVKNTLANACILHYLPSNSLVVTSEKGSTEYEFLVGPVALVTDNYWGEYWRCTNSCVNVTFRQQCNKAIESRIVGSVTGTF